MKKIANIVLMLALALCLCFSLTSCFFLAYRTNATVSEGEMSVVTTPDKEYVIPAGYKEYNNGDISFAYPDEWVIQDGSVVIIVNESGVGNNITISYETLSDLYVNMTADEFEELVAPTYEAMGASITGITVKQVENEVGIAITKIAYYMTLNGVNMEQTMFVFPAGSRNYVVTVTEAEPDPDLVDTVFESIRVEE